MITLRALPPLVLAYLATAIPIPLVARVVINEFMSSNGTTLADEEGSHEDWIELHNTGPETVNLANWGLSDNPSNPFKWRFPEGTAIAASGHLIVWASGKDRQPGEELPGILRELWTDIPGISIANLTSHPSFPDNPASISRITDFIETPTDIADDYGQRLRGILIPPDSGNYRFWIASDDNSQLRLGTSENPASASIIARVDEWTSPCEKDMFASQRSALIPLVAGQRYYLEILMKEGGGSDHLALCWQLPDGTIEEPMPAHHLISPTTGQLHTSFRISSSGEALTLTRSDGATEDQVPATYVPRDVSFGRHNDGAPTWHYFAAPTPGAPNASQPVTLPPTTTIIHQWDFESPSAFLAPSTTLGGGAGINVAIDPAAVPTPAVLRNNAAQSFESAHLRVNEPLGVTLTWALPTTGFGGLSLAWQTRRSGQGAGVQNVAYTTDGETWLPLDSYIVLDAAPQPKAFDLTGIPGAENNPRFAVRVTFERGGGGISGNNRFDNVALTGIPLPGGNPPASIVFDALPASVASGSPLSPVFVRLLDIDGNPAITYRGAVSLALVGAGGLTGTTSVDALNGIATFSDLVLTGTGAFQLIATADGLDPATSEAIRSLSLTALILPQYIQGAQDALGDNNDRVPFAWHARIEGLQPNATYRFANRVVLATDAPANDGAGNAIFITSPTENWIRTTESPRFRQGDLGTRHHQFTTDAQGTHTGWFITEPSGNARFTPGNTVHFRLLLNDGNAGVEIAHILTTAESARVLRFGTAPGDGTGIIGQASTAARRIAVLYDDAEGPARPLAATPVEITGAAVDSRYAGFYQNIVATNQSHWGTILPNNLPGGLRRIDIRTATGPADLLDTRTSAAGFTGTVNPTGGLAAPILLNVDAGLPVFLPGGSATWHTAANWSTGTVPDAPGAQAIVNAPASGDRNVNINAPATLGSLRVHQGATDFRNRIRNNHENGALTFHGGAQPATLRVDGGGGSGHVDLDFSNPVTLATDLVLIVNQADGGDPQQGALRLQQSWNGPGGLIKQGPGLASLTGAGKDFTGTLLIEQGALRVTGPAVPAATSGVAILPGGQLRLVSTGTLEEPRVHHFGGGPIHIGGLGRGGDLPPGQELGVLGALRYDPDSQDNLATLANPLVLTALCDVHIDGTRNTLRLDGALTGNGHPLVKTGGGTLHLAAASPAAPPVAVETGTLLVSAVHPAAITLAENTTLTGSGSVGPVIGDGAVQTGTETLTATSSTAARIAAVLTAPGASGNGTLALSDASDPLPTPPHTIDLFLDPTAPLQPGDRLEGGLATPDGHDLTSALGAVTVNLSLADSAGGITHLGRSYRPASSDDPVAWSVAGNTLEVLITGVATTYAQWRNLHFPDPAARADDSVSGPAATDSIGTTNLMRYAFNLGLEELTAPVMPVVDPATHTFRFLLDSAKSDLAWIVRASPDLSDWTETLLDTRSAPPPAADPHGFTAVSYPPDRERLFVRLELHLIP